jgi:hypothetical protein
MLISLHQLFRQHFHLRFKFIYLLRFWVVILHRLVRDSPRFRRVLQSAVILREVFI